MSPRHPMRRSRSAGFTLLEMLIAVVTGAIVIATVYSIGAGASHSFSHEFRVAQSQSALRMAVEQLRRDVSRAGFGSTPNSAADTGANPAGCPVSSTPLNAVQYAQNAYTDQLPAAALNNVRADGLILEGNFATDDHYLVQSIDAGTIITFQQSRQSFRRSFMVDTDPTAGTSYTISAQRFEDVFRVGRYVYLVGPTGRRVAREISAVSASGTPSVTVSPAIDVGCFGYGRGAVITPVMRIEFFATRPTGRFAALRLNTGESDGSRESRGANQALLARREIDFDGSVRGGSERVLLDYLAHITYRFTIDSNTVPTAAPTLVEVDDLSGESINTTAHRVRSIRYDLSVRTPGYDRDRIPQPARSSLDEPLLEYQTSDSVRNNGVAAVRSIREEVFLENIAARRIMP